MLKENKEEKQRLKTGLDLIKKIEKSGTVMIKFKKKDGSNRLMKCTLDLKLIPKDNLPKSKDLKFVRERIKKYGLVVVYDLEKEGWRSILFNNIEWLKNVNNESFLVGLS